MGPGGGARRKALTQARVRREARGDRDWERPIRAPRLPQPQHNGPARGDGNRRSGAPQGAASQRHWEAPRTPYQRALTSGAFAALRSLFAQRESDLGMRNPETAKRW